MQTRVAVMAIIVEDGDAAEKLNAILHNLRRVHYRKDGHSLSCEGDKYHIHRNRRAAG